MEINVLPDSNAAARYAAAFIAEQARESIAARGRFVLALSGGETPRPMLNALAGENLDWGRVHVVQVDERFAPTGHPDRNLTLLQQTLLAKAPLSPDHVYPMPVEDDDDHPATAADDYARLLQEVAGTPPVIDLVHLGLGGDGHTASLVPGDGALDVVDADVAITGLYKGRRRMTLTYPILNRARCILWLVSGASKAAMLARLRAGDPGIPAGGVATEHAVVFADHDAAPDAAPA
ncbi:MAG TPA: 6-phosphogluconolactonase [Gammaproteobacteria bacterium]|nr:6-phosphogluconolactonase [Gammaproteobacteria bacterium]